MMEYGICRTVGERLGAPVGRFHEMPPIIDVLVNEVECRPTDDNMYL